MNISLSVISAAIASLFFGCTAGPTCGPFESTRTSGVDTIQFKYNSSVKTISISPLKSSVSLRVVRTTDLVDSIVIVSWMDASLNGSSRKFNYYGQNNLWEDTASHSDTLAIWYWEMRDSLLIAHQKNTPEKNSVAKKNNNGILCEPMGDEFKFDSLLVLVPSVNSPKIITHD